MVGQTKSQKVRYGVIGCGEVFRKHAEALEKSEGGLIKAVFDIDDKAAEAASKRCGCEKKTSVESMLQDDGINAVVICTPHDSHKKLVLETIKAGKYALCEKPLVLSSREGDEILRSEHYQSNVITVFQTRFSDASKRLFDIIASGELGQIRLCGVEVYKYRDEKYFGKDWRKYFGKSGGMLPTQGIHALDKMRLICGWPQKVYPIYKNFRPHLKEVEDAYAAAIEFENGVVGTITISTAVRHPRYDYRLFIAGSGGSVAIGGREFERILYLDLRNLNPDLLAFPPVSPSGYQNFFDAVNNFILNGTRDPLLPFAEDGVLATAFIEKIYNAENQKN